MFGPPLALALMAPVGVATEAELTKNYDPKVGAVPWWYGLGVPVVTQPG